MFRRSAFNGSTTAESKRRAAFARGYLIAVLLVVGFTAALVLYAFKRNSPRSPSAEATTPAARSEERSSSNSSKTESRDVYATWYEVPLDSLAKRRAGLDELTAAHNKLPLGTLVRVTHLENGKSVTVRITDRGIHDRKVKLDVCKEAAEELQMVSQGKARVRMEVVPEEHGAAPPESHTAAPQP